ncbi:MAG: hypothetical protein ACTHNI_14185 [Cellulosimicrobium cellulans]
MTRPAQDAVADPRPRDPGTARTEPGGTPRGRLRPDRRRAVATAALTAPVGALLVVAGGGWDPLRAPVWTAVVLVAAVVGASTLATFVPRCGESWRSALGCGPCAAVGALTVLLAAWLVETTPHGLAAAAAGLGAVVVGRVHRRVSAQASCPVP